MALGTETNGTKRAPSAKRAPRKPRKLLKVNGAVVAELADAPA